MLAVSEVEAKLLKLSVCSCVHEPSSPIAKRVSWGFSPSPTMIFPPDASADA